MKYFVCYFAYPLSNANFRYKTRYSPNLKAALGASDRIQRRVEELVKRKDYSLDSDNEFSDESLEVLRDSLREERKVLSEAIREADKEYDCAFD